MEEKMPIKGVHIQAFISPENEERINKYQGGYLIENNKRISKSTVINRALDEFFKIYLDETNYGK